MSEVHFLRYFRRLGKPALILFNGVLLNPKKNVLRGMHFHQRHDEYFHLISGHCLVGLKDIRPDSPTLGAHSLYEMFSSDMSVLVFPRGIIHGWFFYEPQFIYKPSQNHI